MLDGLRVSALMASSTIPGQHWQLASIEGELSERSDHQGATVEVENGARYPAALVAVGKE